MSQTAQYKQQAKAARSGGTTAKLAITRDGPYYLSAAEVAAKLGVSESRARQSIRKGNIHITNRGGSVRYLPKFWDDGLYFYGEAIHSPYTTENIYWLSDGSGDIDMRMPVVTKPAPGTGAAGQVFRDNLRAETDVFAGTVVPVSPGQDFWYWEVLWAGASANFNVPAPGASRTGTATLRMHVQGGTSTPALLDHQATISMNGSVVGSGQWDDLATHTVSANFDQAILGETNTVTVAAAGDPGSIYYVNGFELSYQRRMTAIGDRLTLNAGAESTIVVDGFTNNQLAVVDISNPQSPSLILSARIEVGAGGYQISFSPTTPGGRYLAVSASQVSSPDWFASDEASTLRDSGNQTDYLVIAPEVLKPSADKLAAYRSGSGMSTRVVMLEDIYDEFNHGIADPNAITGFLAHAYRGWTRAPRYVVLLGKGTFDYKDVERYGTNLLPPLMASTAEGMYACDNCYADMTGDGVPEFAIGRIPVTSNAEFDKYYVKLVTSEASGSGRATQVLLAADAQDPPANFTNDANALAARVPGGYTINGIYLDSPPPPSNDLNSARAAMQGLLNGTGASVFAYVGHGGMDRLANGGLLTVGDIGTTVTNGGKMPIIAALSCLINRFEVPGLAPMLGEQLIVNAQGGASAVWSPTGTSNDATARTLGEKLFEAIYAKNISRIGDAALDAMTVLRNSQQVAAQELQVYTLLGDPAAVIPGKSGSFFQGPSNSISGGTSSPRSE
jgi:hypothetical protein